MRSIPIEYIQRFSDALEEVDERAKRQLRNALAKVDLSDVPVARGQIAAIMERIVGASDILASTMAAAFYDGIREYQTGEKLGASTDSGRDPGSTKSAAYGITSKLANAEEPSISLVEGLLVQRIGYEIQRSVGRTMYRNGERDSRKPKYARIPLGGDSCEFCRMLASRGFAYNSEMSAGKLDPDHYHDGCRCRVVCSWEDDPAIAGLSEDEYNDRAWAEHKGAAKSFASKDHSKHERNRKEKRRNRYTDDGKLRAGYSGERIDKQEVYAAEERKKTAVRAAAQRGNAQRGVKRTPRVDFHSEADVALKYFGPAEESHSKELAVIKDDLKKNGVYVNTRDRNHPAMGYGTASAPGKPGSMTVTEGMSYSAWLHEYRHFLDDKELGYPGRKYYYNNLSLYAKMERAAYDAEIELAVSAGFGDLANELLRIRDRVIREIERGELW